MGTGFGLTRSFVDALTSCPRKVPRAIVTVDPRWLFLLGDLHLHTITHEQGSQGVQVDWSNVPKTVI